MKEKRGRNEVEEMKKGRKEENVGKKEGRKEGREGYWRREEGEREGK